MPQSGEKNFTCNFCNVVLSNSSQFTTHLKGLKHHRKLVQRELHRLEAAQDPRVYCKVCSLVVQPAQMPSHLTSLKHLVAEEKNGQLDAEQSESLAALRSKRKANAEITKVARKERKAKDATDTEAPPISLFKECKLCQTQFSSVQTANEHYLSAKHQRKAKYCMEKANGAGAASDIIAPCFLAPPKEQLQSMKSTEDPSLACTTCQVRFPNKIQYDQHCQGFKHALKTKTILPGSKHWARKEKMAATMEAFRAKLSEKKAAKQLQKQAAEPMITA